MTPHSKENGGPLRNLDVLTTTGILIDEIFFFALPKLWSETLKILFAHINMDRLLQGNDAGLPWPTCLSGVKQLPINFTKMLITWKWHKQMPWFFHANECVTSTIRYNIIFELRHGFSTKMILESHFFLEIAIITNELYCSKFDSSPLLSCWHCRWHANHVFKTCFHKKPVWYVFFCQLVVMCILKKEWYVSWVVYCKKHIRAKTTKKSKSSQGHSAFMWFLDLLCS